jgi:pimeloyl-ACP methyl ester carboxylesterase
LHVQRLGPPDAPPVVFLHGLVMDNLSSWYFTVANAVAAAGAGLAILYDLRGHGRSERPATGYRLADHVADLLALLDALELPAATLVGNSFGGLLALAFAAAHPARVRGLVLVDGHLGDDGFAAQMSATLRLEGEARERRIAESFAHWLGRHSERKSNRLADNARALIEHTSLVADLAATPPLGPAELASVRAPLLALYGERSDLRARAEGALSSLPQARVEILAGCTHSILWEATAEVRRRVLAFLAATAGGGAP